MAMECPFMRVYWKNSENWASQKMGVDAEENNSFVKREVVAKNREYDFAGSRSFGKRTMHGIAPIVFT